MNIGDVMIRRYPRRTDQASNDTRVRILADICGIPAGPAADGHIYIPTVDLDGPRAGIRMFTRADRLFPLPDPADEPIPYALTGGAS